MAEWSRQHPRIAMLARAHLGQRSYFDVLNDVIWTTASSYALVVHDDVFLSELIIEDVTNLTTTLEAEWPSWGVCGNAGVLSFGIGIQPTSVIRYLYDAHGGPNFQGSIFPVQSIDGNVILLNIHALRDNNVRLPTFDGFQLYDIVLSIEALASGLAVLVAPQLASYHLSGGSQEGFDRAAKSGGFHHYLSQKLANREIQTLNGMIEIPSAQEQASLTLVDLEVLALRSAVRGRPRKRVAIVVRTQFRDLGLLRRTLETIKAFTIAAGEVTEFTPIVITDRPDRCPDFVHNYAKIRTVEVFDGDTRHRLVKSAEAVDADFLWFVDDDDWLFPNEAERLGLIVNVCPPSTLLFVDTQHFHESIDHRLGGISGNYSLNEGRYFHARDWRRSLSGDNHIPFCGMIVPHNAVRTLPARLVENALFYEDFALQLHALMDPSTTQIVVEKLFAGISVREKGNVITLADRTVWSKSLAEIVADLCMDGRYPNLFSLWPAPPRAKVAIPVVSDHLAGLSSLERSLVLIYRLVRGLLVVICQPRRWAIRARTGIHMFRRDGLLSVVRWTTMLR
jgi:hypothetical protein